MCISCNRTQGDDCLGIGRATDCAVTMVVIGGITALVAAFAANYFESGAVGAFALNTAAILGVGSAVLGISIFAGLIAIIANALQR